MRELCCIREIQLRIGGQYDKMDERTGTALENGYEKNDNNRVAADNGVLSGINVCDGLRGSGAAGRRFVRL
jgi:hypothetical protein